jgi:Ca2+:H+ antiporter
VERHRIESLSEEIVPVLILTYFLSLFFTLVTHRDLFTGERSTGARGRPEWSKKASLSILIGATAGTSWMSHLLVETVEQSQLAIGASDVFMGAIVIAVIGNAAEHWTAILMALRNELDATVQIAVGSSIQIALFVTPVLILVSRFMGHGEALDLHFTLLETVAVVIAVLVLALVCHDGETHWMEGAMMLGGYLILAIAFYNLPAGVAAS